VVSLRGRVRRVPPACRSPVHAATGGCASCSTTREPFYGSLSALHYATARYLFFALQQRGTLRQFYREFRAGAAQDSTGVRTLCRTLGVQQLDGFQPGFEEWVAGLRRE
jgi:hypothetical protein